MQSTSTRSRAISSRRSCGSKRASCRSAAAPREPGRDERVAGGLDQPAAAVHHTSWPGCGREPVLGLQALAGEVALAVQDGLRLARRAAGERDQARVVRARARRAAARVRCLRSNGTHSVSPVQPASRSVAALRTSATTSRGCATASRCARSFGRSCSVHGQHDEALAEAGEHRQRPLRAVSDEREDDVAAADAERVRASRRALPAAPLSSPNVHSRRRAVAGQLDQRAGARRRRFDDVAGEVHRRQTTTAG